MKSQSKRIPNETKNLLNELVQFGHQDFTPSADAEMQRRIEQIIRDLEKINLRIDRLNKSQNF